MVAVVTVVALSGGLQAQARDTARQAGSADDRLNLRYQIGVMERVLEQAVAHGAQVLSQSVQRFMPNLLHFSGPPRARGFRLEGYGTFFDVDVPALSRSVMWSVRTLNPETFTVGRDLDRLRTLIGSLQDGRARNDLEQALRRIELQVGPVPRSDATATGAAPATDPPIAASAFQQNPDEAYTSAVQSALIDAMLDHGASIPLGADEWLTVAARDDEPLGPTDMGQSATILLRVRGGDLAAFRAGRLSRDEARKRVEVRQL
jgi:hypothetical protein